MKNKISYIFLILLTLILGNSYAFVAVTPRIFGVPYHMFRHFCWLIIFGLIVALMLVIKFIKDKSSLRYKILFYGLTSLIIVAGVVRCLPASI